MDYNKEKYKDMIKNVGEMHKNIEEHCNYQIIVREIFRRIEEEFAVCSFDSFNDTNWEEFKKKILEEK